MPIVQRMTTRCFFGKPPKITLGFVWAFGFSSHTQNVQPGDPGDLALDFHCSEEAAAEAEAAGQIAAEKAEAVAVQMEQRQ
jgi:predicted deacylase